MLNDPTEFMEIEECYDDLDLDGIDAIERDMDLADAWATSQSYLDLFDDVDDIPY